MIKALLREIIKDQNDYDLLVYIQTTTRSLQVIHIESANEDFIQAILSNGTTVIINVKFIEYFTIDIPDTRGKDIFETSVEHLEDLLNNQ